MGFALFHTGRAMAVLRAAVLAAAILAAGVPQARAEADLPLFPKDHGHTIIPNRVDIEVAGGPAARVTFDTGSTGLRVRESVVGPNVRRTDTPLREVYGDGTELDGYLGYAVVAFRTRDGSPLRTAREVPIHIVTNVTCRAEKPHCPGLEDAGVMGLRFDEKGGGMLSPLRFLPGALADGFIVDADHANPHVHVGLDAPSTRGFRFARLRPASPAATADGTMPLWVADSIQGCFTVEGGQPACQPVIFDTGGSAMHFRMDGLPPDLLEDRFVRAGLGVSFEVADAFRLAFRSEGHHDVRIDPAPGANSGERFFRHYLVAFDGRGGRIGFLPRKEAEEQAMERR